MWFMKKRAACGSIRILALWAVVLFTAPVLKAGVITHVATWTKAAGNTTAFYGMAFENGKLYAIQKVGTNVVKVFDPATGAILQTVSDSSGLGIGPIGLEVAANGDIWVDHGSQKRIAHHSSDGTYLGGFTLPLSSMGMTIGSGSGHVYAAMTDTVNLGTTLVEYDPNGTQINSWDLHYTPDSNYYVYDFAVDAAETTAWLVELDYTANKMYLISLDLATGTETVLNELARAPSMAANVPTGFDADGNIINIAVRGSSSTVGTSHSVETLLKDGSYLTRFNSWDPGGAVYADGEGANTFLGRIFGLATDESTGRMYVGDMSGNIYVFHDSGVTLTPGDANLDNTVDADDAEILSTNWLMAEGAKWIDGDFNGDGRVDDKDASMLAANWEGGSASASVPEPSILCLIFIGLSTLCCYSRGERKAA